MPGWFGDVRLRMRRFVWLKLFGVSGFMWLFFIGYFHLLRHPVHPVTVMPLTALDPLIPFQPGFLAAYVSLWLYIGVAPGLLLGLRELLVYALWAGLLCGVGLACFYVWPSAVPPQALDVAGHPAFALIQGVDAAGNACPSLHVASAVFSALWIDRVLREVGAPLPPRLMNVSWFAAIAYSTLAIKQHVVLDVIAGLLLGAIVALCSLHRRSVKGGTPLGQERREAGVGPP